MAERHPELLRTVTFGLASLGLYVLLYFFEEPVLRLSAAGGWAFLFPVIIAFLFSFVHGSFTSQFWDFLGIRARTDTKNPPSTAIQPKQEK